MSTESIGEISGRPEAEWNEIFGKHESLASLKANQPVALRSVRWKLFLLYPSFPPSSWTGTIQSERAVYTELKKKYLFNKQDRATFADVNVVNPLSLDASNPWMEYYRDEELRTEIMQDIERTFPDNDFFRKTETQSQLLDILFVYCKMNQDVSYRQGMHELLAPILLVVHNDSIVKPHTIYSTLDRAFVEHDSFALFQLIMRSAKPWYESGDKHIHPSYESPIISKSKQIHGRILTVLDPTLARHLSALNIEPQIWGIRWLRLLFGREFPLNELLCLWDALFAEDCKLHLVDTICAAMLIRIRPRLLESDYSAALTLLLHYPKLNTPASTLVEDAVFLRDHMSSEGGMSVIRRYDLNQVQSLSPRTLAVRSNNKHSTNIESLVSDVARNFIERGEKWGVNRYVRGAVANLGPQGCSAELGRKDTMNERSPENLKQMAQLLSLSVDTLDSRIRTNDDDAKRALTAIRHVRDCLADAEFPFDEDVLIKATDSHADQEHSLHSSTSTLNRSGFARMVSRDEITPPKNPKRRDISLKFV